MRPAAYLVTFALFIVGAFVWVLAPTSAWWTRGPTGAWSGVDHSSSLADRPVKAVRSRGPQVDRPARPGRGVDSGSEGRGQDRRPRDRRGGSAGPKRGDAQRDRAPGRVPRDLGPRAPGVGGPWPGEALGIPAALRALGAPAMGHPGPGLLARPRRLARADPGRGAFPADVWAIGLLHGRAAC